MRGVYLGVGRAVVLDGDADLEQDPVVPFMMYEISVISDSTVPVASICGPPYVILLQADVVSRARAGPLTC